MHLMHIKDDRKNIILLDPVHTTHVKQAQNYFFFRSKISFPFKYFPNFR